LFIIHYSLNEVKRKTIIEMAVKVIVAALTAFLTALGTTSCMGLMQPQHVTEVPTHDLSTACIGTPSLFYPQYGFDPESPTTIQLSLEGDCVSSPTRRVA
jgi:hypothetical protein